MQNAKGEEATAFCREEFQDFMQFFLGPLIQKSIAARLAKAEAAIQKVCCVDGKFLTLAEVVTGWQSRLQQAYQGLQKGLWSAKPNVPWECYRPTALPFFLTMDNAAYHSFYWGSGKERRHMPCLGPLLSLLQIFRPPPHGHDLHQIVEHAIGIAKREAKRIMRDAVRSGIPLTTDLMYVATQRGSRGMTAGSWDSNLVQMMHCLRVVAGNRRDGNYSYTDSNGRERFTPYTQGDFPPEQLR